MWSNIGECLLQGGDLPSEVNGKPATMQSLGLVEEVSTYILRRSPEDCVHTCYISLIWDAAKLAPRRS